MSMSGDQTLNKIWVVFGAVLNIFIQWRMFLSYVSRAILLVKLLGLSFRLKWANVQKETIANSECSILSGFVLVPVIWNKFRKLNISYHQ